MSKPILCLDFDGVLHSYSSGWKGACTISDPPTPGAMKFLWVATDHFTIAILSSRSHQWLGRFAMKRWLATHFYEEFGHDTISNDKFSDIQWPLYKPSAFVTIDDRALTFDGTWPTIETLKTFKPWNKRPAQVAIATSLHPSPPDHGAEDVSQELERKLLTSLAQCPTGKGLLLNSAALKRAAKSLISKGWAESMEAAGIYVCIATNAGRTALTAKYTEPHP